MNIAIYNSSYIEKISYDKNIEFFKEKLNINCKKITIDDIISDKLLNYDLFVIPGGELFFLQHEIGYNGKIKIIEYLQKGGKYIGICAGCFFATKTLHFMGEKISSPNFLQLFNSCKGIGGEIKKEVITDSGGKILYWNGPIEVSCSNDWNILDTISGDPCTFMRNNILLFTCHPELNNYDYYLKYIQHIL